MMFFCLVLDMYILWSTLSTISEVYPRVQNFSLCTLFALAGIPFLKKAALHLGQSNTLKPFLLLCFMVYIPVLVANLLTESAFPNESKNISN